MQSYKLKDNIWWVGAIDWNLRDFHGYETSRGTTYNSYLILDDSPALVDGCRHGFDGEVLSRIAGHIDPKKIEYLVVNHVEMDHSGAVPRLIQELSPVRVLTSKRGEDALRQHYGEGLVESWDLQVVGSGDEVSLGECSLSFIETPMLHWPDSMFTYVTGANVLLSNDAFGQHLAGSERYADEADMHVVMEESVKYFSNILMPFTNKIIKTVEMVKESGLEIEAIGPSHGVMWRRKEDVARILDAYVRWSNFEASHQVALVYETMWHSTEKMTRAIEDGVGEEGVECKVQRLNRTPMAEVARAVQESRGFLIGSPTMNNGMLPPIGALMTYLKGLRPQKRVAGAYGSYGWSGGAAKEVTARLEDLKLQVLEPLEVKYVPASGDLEECREYGREVARAVKEWD